MTEPRLLIVIVVLGLLGPATACALPKWQIRTHHKSTSVQSDTMAAFSLYTYWRFLERDGGTYVQCEAISLTRSIPFVFEWLIGPFVTSVPRESLTFTLEATRNR